MFNDIINAQHPLPRFTARKEEVQQTQTRTQKQMQERRLRAATMQTPLPWEVLLLLPPPPRHPLRLHHRQQWRAAMMILTCAEGGRVQA